MTNRQTKAIKRYAGHLDFLKFSDWIRQINKSNQRMSDELFNSVCDKVEKEAVDFAALCKQVPNMLLYLTRWVKNAEPSKLSDVTLARGLFRQMYSKRKTSNLTGTVVILYIQNDFCFLLLSPRIVFQINESLEKCPKADGTFGDVEQRTYDEGMVLFKASVVDLREMIEIMLIKLSETSSSVLVSHCKFHLSPLLHR